MTICRPQSVRRLMGSRLNIFDIHLFDLGFVIFPFSMRAVPVVEASV
jgi:hypothetical protein